MPSHWAVAYSSRKETVILESWVLSDGIPKEPWSPPPVKASRREVAKLWVRLSAGGPSLLAAVDVTICRRDRIARALPFSLLRIRFWTGQEWIRETDLLLPGRTQLSSSDSSNGLGMYSIPITKDLATHRISDPGHQSTVLLARNLPR